MKFLKSSGLKIGIIIALLVSVISPQTNFINASGQTEYSGEELYKGIIFGQGEFGKKVITNKEEYEKMNSKESLAFADKFVNFIKEKDPLYFGKLKKALYNKDATLSLDILQASGSHFDEYIKGIEDANTGISPQCGVVAVCGAAVVLGAYNYVVVVQAVGAVQVGVAAWALKTKAVNNLLTTSDTDPEAEMAEVLIAL